MSGSRLDKWLFHARFYRTRPLAQAAAQAGRVRLNGVRIEKPGHGVKLGDVLTLVGSVGGRGGQVMAVRILALAERRGPAAEAQKLYEVLEDS
jgi:ribosome-associated heat shock protein Hsp15